MSAKPFVVIAEFTLKPGALADFLAFARIDAGGALDKEEGCLAFDVLLPENGGDQVVFHEVYRDRAAFEEHKGTSHYLAFKEGTGALLAEELSVRFFNPAAAE
ncbi:putative quinol monooxygenase [Pseudomonas sp.]|jgi:autoinducer 2-degrading protein|uniref:putative quinol monooxygenase n=1 Tax=Pseudomonas sp. TaxID=306 RepID=UPI0028ABA54E|nr:putative quinol monooxygenase [Pseudomonas sp.]